MSVEQPPLVSTIEQLRTLRAKHVGERVYVAEDGLVWRWDGDEWLRPDQWDSGPSATGSIPAWENRPYPARSQVYHSGRAWIAPSGASAGQEPGVHGAWEKFGSDTASSINSVLAAELAQIDAADGKLVPLSGRLAALDFGGGDLIGDATSEATVDNITTFAAKDGVGRFFIRRHRKELKPQECGVVANSSSDQTSAMNDWIEVCREEKFRAIVPCADYRIEGSLNIDGQVVIDGDQRSHSRIMLHGPDARVRVNSGAAIGTFYGVIKDLTIQAVSCPIGLVVGQQSTDPFSVSYSFENLNVLGFTESCCDVVVSQVSNWFKCRFGNNSEAGEGMRFIGGPNTNLANTIRECEFYMARKGLFVQTFQDLRVLTSRFERNGEEGIYVERPDDDDTVTRGLLIWGNYFEKNNRGSGRDSGCADIRATTLGTSVLNGVRVERNTFDSDQANNYAGYFGRGEYYVEKNSHNGQLRNRWRAEDASTCWIRGSGFRRPDNDGVNDGEWSSLTGAAAQIEWESANGGPRRWSHIGGTWYQHPRIVAGAEPPSAGSWVAGIDKVMNSSPGIGEPTGWIPIVSGTPGTWVPEGIVPVPPVGLTSFASDRHFETSGWEAGQFSGTSGAGFVVVFSVESQDVSSATRIFHGKNETGPNAGWYFRTTGTNASLNFVGNESDGTARVSPSFTVDPELVGQVCVAVGLLDGNSGRCRLWVNRAEVGAPGTAMASYAVPTGPARIGTAGHGANAADGITVLGVASFTFGDTTPSDVQIEELFDAIKSSYTCPTSMTGATITHAADVALSEGGSSAAPDELTDRVGSDDWTRTGALVWRPFALGFAY